MADAWSRGDAYEPFIGRWSRGLAPGFVEWARIAPEARVLDVGCGTGALSEALVERGAQVVGVDRAPAYVEDARRRLPRALFEVADATALPFGDGAFDAAVSGLVLNFVPEPRRMLAEMRRVVRPGGTVALYVWDYAGKMQMLRHFWDAAVAVDPGARAWDEGVRFPLCHPAELSRILVDAGLREVETRAIDHPTPFRGFDDLWTPFLGGQGPAPSYVAGLEEKHREALREALRARLPAERDGSIPLVARAWAARAYSPARS